MEFLLLYIAVGIVSGVLAGLLGVGGGLVIVPALALLFSLQGFHSEIIMHLAIGTSLLTIVATALSSIYAHQRYGNIRWDLVKQLTPGLLISALLGAAVADLLHSNWLKILFGSFLLAVALQLAFALLPTSQHRHTQPAMMHTAGGVIGIFSSLLGIGGGTLTVPFLVWCNVMIKEAVATSAACGLPIALAGATGFIILGWDQTGLPTLSSGYVYWPAASAIIIGSVLTAPIGAWLAQRLPIMMLKRLFAVFLLVAGLKMLVG